MCAEAATQFLYRAQKNVAYNRNVEATNAAIMGLWRAFLPQSSPKGTARMQQDVADRTLVVFRQGAQARNEAGHVLDFCRNDYFCRLSVRQLLQGFEAF